LRDGGGASELNRTYRVSSPLKRTTLSGPFVFGDYVMNEDLDFDKLGGLIPAVVQDAKDAEVLMVGFMNREALERSLAEGYVTFFSRTRNKLWTKGETSGNRLRIISASTDCDRDSLLLCVNVEGGGVVCHRGTRSCFTEPVGDPVVQSLAESATRSER
jgi:phosphoribosyl-AMP cyclohydrolase